MDPADGQSPDAPSTVAPSPDVPSPNGSGTVLEVRGLRKFFPIRQGLLRRTVGHIRAVDDVAFDLRSGETLAIVGESGSGKTTTARCIVRAVDPSSGEIVLHTEAGRTVDLASLPRKAMR